jgi:putative transposase
VIDSLIGQGINVRHACRVLGVSESGYYDWKDRPAPPRPPRRIWLAGEIANVHKASAGTYGHQRVTAELRHGREADHLERLGMVRDSSAGPVLQGST